MSFENIAKNEAQPIFLSILITNFIRENKRTQILASSVHNKNA
jgi:hypothetical protein